LDNGYDSSDWKEKQYDHTRAGTRPVAQKAANPWGLYDMLGNVWEWCCDRWHDSYKGAPTDGSAWIDPAGAANHVVRGGSWINDARFVRAAYRGGRDPAYRNDYFGFRCARVQSESVASEMERRAGRSKRRERSDPAATTSPKRGPSDRPRGKRKPT
jgi:formylglycine-generating enzyme required for sulfatase activity